MNLAHLLPDRGTLELLKVKKYVVKEEVVLHLFRNCNICNSSLQYAFGQSQIVMFMYTVSAVVRRHRQSP